ncbi:MAG: hypothetical protein R2761_02455 [Acidimicrobiales bacterium]
MIPADSSANTGDERRRHRQRREIVGAIDSGDLARAADLIQVHGVEFPDDADLRDVLIARITRGERGGGDEGSPGSTVGSPL